MHENPQHMMQLAQEGLEQINNQLRETLTDQVRYSQYDSSELWLIKVRQLARHVVASAQIVQDVVNYASKNAGKDPSI